LQSSRILKLLQRSLVFLLAEELKAALQRIGLSQSGEREKKRRQRACESGSTLLAADTHWDMDSMVFICVSA
jgi:hypothetical protein